jgi:dipeptidyl aminopeptidase/acylaminoacyl peptidase
MVGTWGEFATAAPDIAARGKELLYRTGHGEALLVTVRGDDPPQAHPISVGVVNGGLYAFILRSPKLRDLEHDGRYALHAHFDPKVPHEFLIRGRVRPVADTRRAILAADWDWSVGNAPVFEFLVEDALYGERASAVDWPPRYAAWPGVTKGSD